MKLKKFPNTDCRGFVLSADEPSGITGTDVTVYRDQVHITQYWKEGESTYVSIEGEMFGEFMEGITECLAVLGEAPPKEVIQRIK